MLESHHWLGSRAPHLDHPFLFSLGDMVLGVHGGSRAAGARKNEDAALLWTDTEGGWHFAIVIDAHNSSDSTELLIELFRNGQEVICETMSLPLESCFSTLQTEILALFNEPWFLTQCRQIVGQASLMICAEKEGFFWWFSIGDCILYNLHPQLAKLGQYAVNQRQFYEWVGHINTFDLPVPAYTSGVRELRRGENIILLATDGLLDYGDLPFQDGAYLYNQFDQHPLENNETLFTQVRDVLNIVDNNKGRDSTTIIAWRVKAG